MHILPCSVSKQPLTKHGFLDATTCVETLEWWSENLDDPQIAIACAPSGLVVVDVDDPAAWQRWLADQALSEPATTEVITPSGGRHLYFLSRPGAVYPGQVCPGVDIKHKGYVLAPPARAWSQRQGVEGNYEWAPSRRKMIEAPRWLEHWVDGRVNKSSAPIAPSRPATPLAELQELLSHIDPDAGGYQRWVLVLMCLHDATDGSHDGLNLAITWSSPGEKYREGEIEQKWRTFRPGPGKGASVIASLAREAGADLAAIGRKHAAAAGARSSQFDVEKWFASLDLSAVDVLDDEDDDQAMTHPGSAKAISRKAARVRPRVPRPRATMSSRGAASDPLERRVSDLRSKMMKASEAKPCLASRYLVKGWLDRTSVSVVFGPSNVGKSFFVLDVANHVASGNSWNGRLVRPGTVFYVVAEGARSFQNRLAALADGASENLHIIFTALDLCMDVSDAMALGRLLQEGAATWGPPALVVIDTLARSLGGGDENSGPDMGRLIDHLGVLQEMTGAHVMLVHHTGKDTERGARGHSSLRAAVDTEIEISRSGDESVVKTKKQRDLEGGGRLAFTLETVVLGIDDDGDEVTSCCVRYAATSSAQGLRATPLGPCRRRFFESWPTS